MRTRISRNGCGLDFVQVPEDHKVVRHGRLRAGDRIFNWSTFNHNEDVGGLFCWDTVFEKDEDIGKMITENGFIVARKRK